MRHHGLQMGYKHFFEHPKWSTINFRKNTFFEPFLTHLWLHNGPFSSRFGNFHGLKRVTSGSKWPKNTCLSIPNGLGSLVEKCVFDPLLTHFWLLNGPFSRHFGIVHGPKRATTGSKRPNNNGLSNTSGLGTTLEKTIFSRRGPRWTHHWPQPCAGRAPVRLHQVTIGTGL